MTWSTERSRDPAIGKRPNPMCCFETEPVLCIDRLRSFEIYEIALARIVRASYLDELIAGNLIAFEETTRNR